MDINYHFKNNELLKIALTHPSVTKSKNKNHLNYERLEFLGDSVLNLVIAEIIYHTYDSCDEGELSVIHANLINTDSISKIAKNIKLDQYIILDAGEEASGGRGNIKNLENAMEALIGAVFLDSDYTTVKKFISDLWQELICNHDEITKKNNKSLLQEYAQKLYNQLPVYKIEDKVGSSHLPIFTISVEISPVGKEYAQGKSKKQAEQLAAEKMLLRISKDHE